jgi:transposase
MALSIPRDDESLRARIREYLAGTTFSEREIALRLNCHKSRVSRVRIAEQIQRPAGFRRKAQTVNAFEDLTPEEIAARAERLRAGWSPRRIREQEGVVSVDYSRDSWNMRDASRQGG